MILSAPPLEQNRILGDTDLGQVAEAAPPTSDAGTLRVNVAHAPPPCKWASYSSSRSQAFLTWATMLLGLLTHFH